MTAIASASSLRSANRVLVASADAVFRNALLKNFACSGSEGEEAFGGAHALQKLSEFSCDSVVLDRRLPDLDAGEVAELIRKRYPHTDVEFVDSLESSAESKVALVLETSESLARKKIPQLPPSRTIENSPVSAVAEPLSGMIGTGRAMRQLYKLVHMVAPRDTTVLITGETGTGKELVAQAVHELSPRARQPFVVVNCAAIPEALLEAELFGHARGAFTGAVQSRLGRIHVAQGGTLFLDEIGELPLGMQAKLLRFLQNGEVQRLGSSDVQRVDVRVVCATNVNLLDLVESKLFRQDLYYRLAIFPLSLPPLRERVEDIHSLAEYFLSLLTEENVSPLKQLSEPALAHLQKSRWPGNVRELKHAIERAFILSENEPALETEHFLHLSIDRQLSEI